MAEINQDDYRVSYDPETAVITYSGRFRLRGEEYAPIAELLNEAADAKPPKLTLDLRKLQFLNSSGINILSKFVLRVRKHNVSAVTIIGNAGFPWQHKSLKNMQRLLPGLQVKLEEALDD